LIGLVAVTADGTEVGTVMAVHDFGAGDILELQPRAGGTTLMLPFTDAFVPAVDLAAGPNPVAPAAPSGEKRGSDLGLVPEKACPGLDSIGANLSNLSAVMPAKAGIQ